MMQKILTATLVGYEAAVVEIETDVSNGLPATIIVGLPDTMVQESRERVRTAIRHAKFVYPPTRVSINLAPSNVPKYGSHFDVGIALSILLSGKLLRCNVSRKLFIGELALDGSIRSGHGILPMVLAAKKAGIDEVFVPEANIIEASLVEGVVIYGATSLAALIVHLQGGVRLAQAEYRANIPPTVVEQLVDLSDIAGQSFAKRALEIAAAGGHNIRFIGAPGSGKTMLAKALAGILPPFAREELLETTTLYSVAGELPVGAVVSSRPFRSPHHTASTLALIGGGGRPKPGEVSLAHGGVLFLDEFPEFPRPVLEVLRQPLEDGVVTISRTNSSVRFPARFMLVAAQNPCHCGNFGDELLSCTCSVADINRYNKKLSGPLLDRIDLHTAVPRLRYEQFTASVKQESSAEVRTRIIAARSIQTMRFGIPRTNCALTSAELKQHCPLNDQGNELLARAAHTQQLSGRSIHRIIKVARTIADLAGAPKILPEHIAESLQYRLPKQE